MKIRAFFLGLLSLLFSVGAFAEDAAVGTAITTAQTEITGYIGSWGAAVVAVALLGVGWRVGVRLIKRMASAA